MSAQDLQDEVAGKSSVELRVRCRLAWNGWSDNETSRMIIADQEAKDPVSARSWDRVVASILNYEGVAELVDAPVAPVIAGSSPAAPTKSIDDVLIAEMYEVLKEIAKEPMFGARMVDVINRARSSAQVVIAKVEGRP